MNPLEHTGDSQNIAFYAEHGRPVRYVWAEVLRSDFDYLAKPPRLRDLPVFHFTVNQLGRGEVTRFTYEPDTRPEPGPLPTGLVTALVQEKLARLDTPQYRQDYERRWRYARREKASLDHLDRSGARNATYDGYLDQAAGREKWHLLHCPDHGKCP